MNDKTIQELREWEKKWPHSTLMGAKEFNKILSRAEQEAKEEPLAVMAARKKGVRCIRTWPYQNGGFAVDVDCDDGLHGHEGNTLEQAESKARAYLNGLPDKEAK